MRAGLPGAGLTPEAVIDPISHGHTKTSAIL